MSRRKTEGDRGLDPGYPFKARRNPDNTEHRGKIERQKRKKYPETAGGAQPDACQDGNSYLDMFARYSHRIIVISLRDGVNKKNQPLLRLSERVPGIVHDIHHGPGNDHRLCHRCRQHGEQKRHERPQERYPC